MSEPKPFASLGPTLLARKGAAKPAMRPQVQPIANFERPLAASNSDHADDDLGWNDMGHEPGGEQQGGDVLALTPAPANADAQAESDATDRATQAELDGEAMPEVLRQQEAIANRVAAASARQARKSAKRRSALEAGRRAAFTLRVDAERHLKLRLACTIRNLSAQQIVTEALDALLSDIPELDTLASQVKRK